MGLFDSVFSTFDSAVSGLFGTSGSYLGDSSQSGSPFPVEYVTQQPQQMATYQNAMAMAPQIGTGALAIGRSLATRFPQLWAGLMALGQQFGKRFTPEMMLGMLRKYGPNMVVGLIGAAALNELIVWSSTHKRRRMNVANTRALRRSVRRLKGFDRLSHRVSAQLSRVGGHRRRSVGRRCGTCRKSPCSC